MKSSLLVLALLVALAGLTVPVESAPNNGVVLATLVDGSNFDSRDGPTDAPLLLKFWATWCVACLQEMPTYTHSFETHGQQVQFLAVNVAVSDPLDRVKKTIADYGLNMPVAYDESGELWDQFNVIGTPTYVLVGRDGEILYRAYGHNNALEAALDEAVALNRANGTHLTASRSDGSEISTGDAVHDIDDNLIDLSVRDGEVLIGYHFAVWCTSYVKHSYPELSEKCRSFDERIRALEALNLPGARLIGFATVYSTNEASLAEFRDGRNIDYPLVFDRDNAYGLKFGTRSFPHLTVVASGGEVVYSGDNVPEDIDQIIKEAVMTGR